MSDESRLERIERKLDEVGEAIVAMARMEEKMITLFKRMDKLDENQQDHEKRVRSIENKVGNNGQMLRFIERIFWIVFTAAVGYVFYKSRGM